MSPSTITASMWTMALMSQGGDSRRNWPKSKSGGSSAGGGAAAARGGGAGGAARDESAMLRVCDATMMLVSVPINRPGHVEASYKRHTRHKRSTLFTVSVVVTASK